MVQLFWTLLPMCLLTVPHTVVGLSKLEWVLKNALVDLARLEQLTMKQVDSLTSQTQRQQVG